MCKPSCVSLGLVTALAVALLCNVYLIFLLWSGEKIEYQHVTTSSSVTVKPEASINLMISQLNSEHLKVLLNTTKRLKRNPSRSLVSVMNKLKRELKARGSYSTGEMIQSSQQVVTLSTFHQSVLQLQNFEITIFITLIKVGVSSIPNPFICTRSWRNDQLFASLSYC